MPGLARGNCPLACAINQAVSSDIIRQDGRDRWKNNGGYLHRLTRLSDWIAPGLPSGARDGVAGSIA